MQCGGIPPSTAAREREEEKPVFFLVFGCVSDIREKSWSSLGTMASRFSYQRPENAISKAEEFIQVGELKRPGKNGLQSVLDRAPPI